jgi:hypothetical protein
VLLALVFGGALDETGNRDLRRRFLRHFFRSLDPWRPPFGPIAPAIEHGQLRLDRLLLHLQFVEKAQGSEAKLER